jgi:4-amino-4-deoxy-L-arabinose transferase-like glycosyltransferase
VKPPPLSAATPSAPTERPPRSATPLLLGIGLAAGGIALLIAWSALDLVPHVTDSVAYLFQGRIFAAGALYLPPPPFPFLFGHENILLDATRWCSAYTPGWPLLLTLGWWIHAPWLLSPLLLALAVVGVGVAGRRLYDRTTGLLAALALAASPFALLMAADAMAHVPALCATVWCVAELIGAVRGAGGPAGRRHLLAAGACGGLAFLIRPFTAVALLAPWALWGAWALLRRRRPQDLLWIAAGALPCLAVLAAYNQRVFGGPLTSGYVLFQLQRFGPLSGMAEPLRIALLHNLPWYLRHLDGCLWGFPWGDLVLLPLVLLARPWRLTDAILALSAASLIVAHSFFPYGDIIYSGPRYAFESLGPLSLLAARALTAAAARLQHALQRLPRGVRLAAAGVTAAALLYFPLGRRLPAQVLHHAQWYLAQSGGPLRAGQRAGVGSDPLVFVAGSPWCYTSFLLANSLYPARGGPVYVRDVPPLRAAVMEVYRRPETWIVRVVVTIDPRHPDQATPREISWQRLH